MGMIPLWIIEAASLMAALSFYFKNDYPMTVVWSGYAFANIGFLWQAMK